MNYIVYKTTNLVNGKIYIGIHKQEGDQFDGYYGSGILLYEALEKYGAENFIRETLFKFETLQEARDKEREIVNETFCKDRNNYNLSVGGTGGNTLAGHSEETKRLIFEKRIMTNIERGNFVYEGKKLEAAIQRMKKNRIQPNNKNRIYGEDALENIKDGARKRIGKYIWITNEKETKLHDTSNSIPENWFKGRGDDVAKFKSHTKESRQKISEKIKGDVCYNNGIKNIKIKVGENPPLGYVPGMIQVHKKNIWITDGINSKKICSNDELPVGWKYGRTVNKGKKDGR